LIHLAYQRPLSMRHLKKIKDAMSYCFDSTCGVIKRFDIGDPNTDRTAILSVAAFRHRSPGRWENLLNKVFPANNQRRWQPLSCIVYSPACPFPWRGMA
jgi:hypothetical protein